MNKAVLNKLEDIAQWRRDLHQHPELGFNEFRTADIVAAKLADFGYQVHRGLGKTGVVGTLKVGTSSRCIGLRADMDALPIQEANRFPHCSVNPKVMHACGHDGHTAMLLGAARYLAQTQAFNGTLHVIFQPAEEGLGGAQTMIEDGLFEQFPVDEIYGMHNWPGMPVGQFGVCHGAMLASSDTFDITLTGKGGHAAQPHQAIDPIIAATELVGQLQTLVSRNTKPLNPVVISVTQLEAGSAYNVIPDQAIIRGCVRTLSPDAQSIIQSRMQTLVDNLEATWGVKGELAYRPIIPVLLNTPEQTQKAIAAATAVVGVDNVDGDMEPTMGAEDFAFMLQHKPGCYVFMGNGDLDDNSAGQGPACMLHNPGYDFNDKAIEWGVKYWCQLVESQLV